MALFLSREEIWDRSFAGLSRENEAPYWSGNLFCAIVFIICKPFFRYRVDGRENLRLFYKKQGVVVIANHASFLDPVFMVLAGRLKQWIRLMGRDNLFNTFGGFGGQVLSRLGAFPVKRDSADMTAIKRASRMLKNCEAVGVFPEGTRRGKTDRPVELHSGAAFIARMGKAPLLPATIRNAEKVKEKGKFFRFPKVTIEFGTPVVLSDFDFLPKDERLDACTWYAMRECFALSYQCKADEVNMNELYTTTKDYSEVFEQNPIPRRSTAEYIASLDNGTSSKEVSEKDR